MAGWDGCPANGAHWGDVVTSGKAQLRFTARGDKMTPSLGFSCCLFTQTGEAGRAQGREHYTKLFQVDVFM